MSVPLEFGEAAAALPAASSARWAGARRWLRLGSAFGCCAAALWLLANQAWYRGAEAALAGHAVSSWLGYPVMIVRPRQTMYFAFHGTGPAHMLGLQVSLGCSSVLLVTPLMLLTGALMSMRRAEFPRLALAAVLATALVVGMNILRLVMIAVLVDWWGQDAGFGWGHTLFGSVMMLAGMAAALLIYVILLGRRRRPAARPEAAGASTP